MTLNFREPFLVLTTGTVLFINSTAMATHGPRSGQGPRTNPLRPGNLLPGIGRNAFPQGMTPQPGTSPYQQGNVPTQPGAVPTQPQNLAITPIATPAPAKAAQTSQSLSQQMNELCVSMHKTYGGMKSFGDAYREAYELLELAKKIDAEIAAGGTPKSVGNQLLEFEGEIRHVEHHLAEFATLQGSTNRSAQLVVSRNLNSVESTVEGMLKQAGVDRTIAPPPPPPIANTSSGVVTVSAVSDPAQLVSISKELTQKTNEFCVEMHKTYQGQPEFNEAYREAFELLQFAKKIEKDVAAGSPSKSIGEQLADFDSELHHVENHVGDFAKAQGANNKTGQQSVATSLEAVESTLERMMGQLGLRRKAEEGHNHSAPAAVAATGAAYGQMTSTLNEKIGSFCNAMDHNFRNNPDFPEAYREAYAVYAISKKVVELSKNNEINAECRELLLEIDGEIHHLEEHVDSFKADDKGTGEGSRRVKRKLADVEETLHALMAQAGIKRKHVE